MSARNTFDRGMAGWWRRNPHFVRYMLRELTAVFLAAYAILLLAGLAALGRGPESWAAFLEFLRSPTSVALHALILVAALYHTWTWFQVSPKAMPPVVLGGRRVPDRYVIGAQLLLFVAVTIALLSLAGAA